MCLIAPGEWHTLRLPAGPGALRLDPLNQPGQIEIRRLRISEADTSRDLWDASSAKDFATIRVAGDGRVTADGLRFKLESTGNDPQILLPTTAGLAPQIVEIEIRVTLSARADDHRNELRRGR